MQAWAPFGEGKNHMFQNPILKDIADKHRKTTAQVILRWLMQRNIVALAKSIHIERIKENLEIFDFQISDEEMQQITELDTKTSLFFDHQTPETVDRFVNLIEERKERFS